MFYRGKKVLVTGGSGFVGTHIVQHLLGQGAKVRVSLHKRPMIIKDGRIETVPANLMNETDCVRAAEGVDYIFHAAGAVGAAGIKEIDLMSTITSNLTLTANMLQAGWKAGARRFLVFSSSTAYPSSDYPIREDQMWDGPTHPAYFGYGWMRRYIERLSEFVASKSNMQVAIVRPTAVYGRWDNFSPRTCHVIPALVRKAVHRQDPYEVWGSGDEVRDFLHITDFVRGCLLMLERHAVCDPVNIGFGVGIAIKNVVGIALKAAGHEGAKVIFNSSRPTTIPLRVVDTSKARQLLGFEPEISLEDGLSDLVRWYSQTHRDNRD